MHNTPAVEVPQGKYDLSSDKLDSWFLKPLHFEDVIVNIPTRQELEEKVNSQLILKHEVH